MSIEKEKQYTREPLEPFEEARQLMREEDWEEGKKELESREKSIPDRLRLAAQMKKFDPERFEKEVKIGDNLWRKFLSAIEYQRDLPYFFMEGIAALRTLNPERFDKEVKIDETELDKIVKTIEEKRGRRDFAYYYDLGQQIDRKRIQERVKIGVEDWGRIVRNIKESINSPIEEIVGYVSFAQRVKPEGFPDVVLPKRFQQDIKGKMADELQQGNLVGFLEYANHLKDVRFE